MAIENIVTRGFSNGFFSTDVQNLVTVGYTIGEPVVFPTCDSGGYTRITNLATGGNALIQNLSGGLAPIVELSGGYSRITNIPTGGITEIQPISGGVTPLCQ